MEKLILYSSVFSQWASVPLLGLVEKQYQTEDYEIREVEFLEAKHLSSEYLKVNKNGTVPTLMAPSLPSPLIESTDILEYLDKAHAQRGTLLAPSTTEIDTAMRKVIELVHSGALDTTLFFFGARNEAEMERLQLQHFDFLNARRVHFREDHTGLPIDEASWASRTSNNEKLLRLCNSPIGEEHYEYFEETETRYQTFAAAFGELERSLVLPWAAGEQVTYADLHIAPWLSHAMFFAEAKDIEDVDSLEMWVAKSVGDFRVGPKVREWWKNIQGRESFRKVFPALR